MSKFLVVVAIVFACAVLSGCNEDQPFRIIDQATFEEDEIKDEIAKLAAIKEAGTDPEADADYEEAKAVLIQRGAGIQSILFEELAANEDWGVRLGIVHVLDSVGTKRMVEPLIERLTDPHHRVAFKAMYSLRGVTGHQVVPEFGEVDGIPAIPQPAQGFDPKAQMQLFSEWHAMNGNRLQDKWSAWWAINANRVDIE
jgi:outer membrane murein-binding lipoprotein Lpp